jgi:diguanylate cyclase (GGDEF)-like protein
MLAPVRSQPRMAGHAEAARWAVWLYGASGALAFVSLLTPSQGDRHGALLGLLAVGDLAIAAIVARWPPPRSDRRGLAAIAAAGLLMAFLFALAGAVPSFGHPTFFLLLFAWIGSALPRGYSLRFAAPAAVAYVVPLVIRDAPAQLVASVVIAVPVMVLIAEVIAAGIGRLEELNDELRHAVRSDELTGVGNRRRADDLLRGLASGDGVIMIDIDNFKRVNDRCGHAAGDDLLAQLGSLLRRTVRGVDLVARYGGDEFIVLAPSAGEHAVQVAERIAAAWRATPGLPTLSLGVAVHEPPESAAATLQRADAAVYAAKRAGRDRIRVAEHGNRHELPRHVPEAPARSALTWS